MEKIKSQKEFKLYKLANGRIMADYIKDRFDLKKAIDVVNDTVKWLNECGDKNKTSVEVSIIDMGLHSRGGYGEFISVDRDDFFRAVK